MKQDGWVKVDGKKIPVLIPETEEDRKILEKKLVDGTADDGAPQQRPQK